MDVDGEGGAGGESTAEMAEEACTADGSEAARATCDAGAGGDADTVMAEEQTETDAKEERGTAEAVESETREEGERGGEAMRAEDVDGEERGEEGVAGASEHGPPTPTRACDAGTSPASADAAAAQMGTDCGARDGTATAGAAWAEREARADASSPDAPRAAEDGGGEEGGWALASGAPQRLRSPQPEAAQPEAAQHAASSEPDAPAVDAAGGEHASAGGDGGAEEDAAVVGPPCKEEEEEGGEADAAAQDAADELCARAKPRLHVDVPVLIEEREGGAVPAAHAASAASASTTDAAACTEAAVATSTTSSGGDGEAGEDECVEERRGSEEESSGRAPAVPSPARSDEGGSAQDASASQERQLALPEREEEERRVAESKQRPKIEPPACSGGVEAWRSAVDETERVAVKPEPEPVKRVCLPCRKKKRRCSGGRPCEACEAEGNEAGCVDPDGARGRSSHRTPKWGASVLETRAECDRLLASIEGMPRVDLDGEEEEEEEEEEDRSSLLSGRRKKRRLGPRRIQLSSEDEQMGDEKPETKEEDWAGASGATELAWSCEVELEWQREEERMLRARELEERERQLEELAQDLGALMQSERCAPDALRLAWHDAASFRADAGEAWPMSGGANGSIRMLPEVDYPCHQGLYVILSLLHQLQHKYHLVSAPDIFQMAAAVAVTWSGGPEIEMKWGRCEVEEPEECAAEAVCHQSKVLCAADGSEATVGDQLRSVFRRMGFLEDREVVCLMGAQALGRAHSSRSPHAMAQAKDAESATASTQGGRSWAEEWMVFDNSYFKALLKEEKQDPFLLWVESDLALIQDPGFRCWVEVYAQDQGLFFADYAATHKKMSELGAKFDPEEGIVIDSIGILLLD